MNRASVIFLRGGPAVGKSTLARALADCIRRSAVVEQDVLRYMVRGGLVACRSGRHPSEDPEGYERQCRIGDENALAVARSFAEEGFVPIIAGFDGGESAQSFRLAPGVTPWSPSPEKLSKLLPGLATHQIILDASPAVLRDRLAARGLDAAAIRFVLSQRERFLQRLEKAPPDVGVLRIDTGASDARTAVTFLLERIPLLESVS